MVEGGSLLLNLDLEKAFDCVSHKFMFNVLNTMGFNHIFVSMNGLLYVGAKSKVKIHDRVGRSFNICKSVRQGCPLSLLLFSCVTETLVTAVVTDSWLLGLSMSPGLGNPTC